MGYLRTSAVAKAAGLHPNTIRLYEEWGLLPEIPRSPSGYRLFSHTHLEQIKLIRLAFKCTIFGRDIKRTAYVLIKSAACSDFDKAFDLAITIKDLIAMEIRLADDAVRYLEQWAVNYKSKTVSEQTDLTGSNSETISIREAAAKLHVTVDMLRDWERNNLIRIPRNPGNGYRMYGTDEINRLKVIRSLRRSNYSNMAILRTMQKLACGSTEVLREALDTPDLDDDRSYLCFTDYLLTALYTARDSVNEIIQVLRIKTESPMI